MIIKDLYKETHDSGDPWGSAISAFFDVATELWWRGDDIPDAWQFRPGAVTDPRNLESYLYPDLSVVDSDDLLQFGKTLERYTRNLDRTGKSY